MQMPVGPLSFGFRMKKKEVKVTLLMPKGQKQAKVLSAYVQYLMSTKAQGSKSPRSLDLSRDLSRFLCLSYDRSFSLFLPRLFREVSDGARKLFKLGIDFHLELASGKCKGQLC